MAQVAINTRVDLETFLRLEKYIEATGSVKAQTVDAALKKFLDEIEKEEKTN